jgi:16S rRNA (cytosine967-C5)-methyltransferase
MTFAKITGARLVALKALHRVLSRGAYPDEALDAELSIHTLTPRDKALANEMLMGVLRWLHRLDHMIKPFVRGKIRKEGVRNILRLGVYQIAFLGGIADYAAINETVEIAKNLYGREVAGFVNAVLRKVAENLEGIAFPDIDSDPLGYIEVVNSFPRWLVEKWTTSYGLTYTLRLTEALNQIPPLCLRANRLKVERQQLIDRLRAKGIEAEPARYAPQGIYIKSGGDPSALEEYGEGLFTVQDEAAQLASFMLAPKRGERVLDACCAPGGKTTHIAELMDNTGEIVANDIRPERVRLTREHAERLGIGIVKTTISDASSPELGSLVGNGFDRVVIDAPCSGLGVIRRNPDTKWKRSWKDVEELAELEYRILTECSKLVRAGGIMLYVVCTLMPEENEKVCERFLREQGEFVLDPPCSSVGNLLSPFVTRSGFFLTDPVQHGTDGFFAARFRRKQGQR